MPSEDDELARTATAPGTPAPAPPTEATPRTLGKYQLERELGAGGMGVVHAAFDPDLERRVAVKVLRTAAGGEASRQRLLREARAMARLTHPNVITVHEVGSSGGQDFVAMELVDGGTLADWVRAEKRSEVAVIDAFVAAGKGLAAAHAAGIVHRDFKPHNVLRSAHGRVVVTDFGLARAADAPEADPMAATQDLASAVGSGSGSLGELTATGAFLGTPAYMAPEQWRGEVSTASDQFAYCVALWEALAGKRPFSGATIDELRAEIEAGPDRLDVSVIPRRLRPILVRGLSPDPTRRFASMDALLAAIRRAERRPAVLYAIGGAVLVLGALVAAVVLVMGRAPAASAPACKAPALDPAQVWSPERDRALASRPPVHAILAKDHAAWLTVREEVCELPPQERGAPLACLDAVASYQDMLADIGRSLPPAAYVTPFTAMLVDPALCSTPRPPRLVPATPQLRAMVAAAVPMSDRAEARTAQEVERLVALAGTDSCALTWAYLFSFHEQGIVERTRILDLAEQASLGCDDEYVRAMVAAELGRTAIGGLLPSGPARMRAATAAIERVKQADLTAAIDLMRMDLAMRDRNYDAALAALDAARAKFAARRRTSAELDASAGLAQLYLQRKGPGDRERADQIIAELRPRVIQELGETSEQLRELDILAARRLFGDGDLEAAHAAFAKLWRSHPIAKPLVIRGRVVDARGTPVAGATVFSGESALGTSITAAERMPGRSGDLRETTTGADGTFTIEEGAVGGIVIAQLGDQRSAAVTSASTVELRLAPTSRIEGTVNVQGRRANDYALIVQPADAARVPYRLAAPIRSDGTFSLSGVPRGKVIASVVHYDPMYGTAQVKDIVVKDPVVSGIAITAAPSERTLSFLLRSTINAPLANAQLWVIPGGTTPRTLIELVERPTARAIGIARPLDETTPAAVRSVAKRGDLVVTIKDVAAELTQVCAIPLPDDLADETLGTRVMENDARIPLVCAPVAPGTAPTVLEVPPWPRLD